MTDVIIDHAPPSKTIAARPWLRRWLKIIASLTFIMVLVGGATRLTDSGLSITEWQPVTGIVPPLNTADWQMLFGKYQLSSEFKLQNAAMKLEDFKFIFWWEWGHRVLGRIIGLAFIPIFIMGLFGRLEKRQWPRVTGLFVLVLLQAALGWYMVKSGLTARVDVSQYRLAAHLTLACVFFAVTLWILFGIETRRSFPTTLNACVALLIMCLVFLQIAAGGFVAGLDAGQGYNSWPQMNGQWIPDGLSSMQPLWRNYFENALTVQFNHRMLAYLILIVVIWHALRTFSLSAMLLVYAVLTQACIGILTLLLHVPIGIALLHQAGALLVLSAAMWNLHKKTASSPI